MPFSRILFRRKTRLDRIKEQIKFHQNKIARLIEKKEELLREIKKIHQQLEFHKSQESQSEEKDEMDWPEVIEKLKQAAVNNYKTGFEEGKQEGKQKISINDLADLNDKEEIYEHMYQKKKKEQQAREILN